MATSPDAVIAVLDYIRRGLLVREGEVITEKLAHERASNITQVLIVNCEIRLLEEITEPMVPVSQRFRRKDAKEHE